MSIISQKGANAPPPSGQSVSGGPTPSGWWSTRLKTEPIRAKRGLGFAIDQFEKVLRKKGAGDGLPEIDKGNSSVGEACDGPAACEAAAGGRELFTVGPEPTLPSAQPLTERLRRRVGMFGGLGG